LRSFTILDVVVERQEVDAAGNAIGSAKIVGPLEAPPVDRKVATQIANFLKWAEQWQQKIARPAFYETDPKQWEGIETLPQADYPGPAVADAPAAAAATTQPVETVAPAGSGGTPSKFLKAPGVGANPFNLQQAVSIYTAYGPPDKAAYKKLLKPADRAALEAATGESSSPGKPGQNSGGTPEPAAKAADGRVILAAAGGLWGGDTSTPNAQGDVPIWAHDLSGRDGGLEPGKRYRYRMQLIIKNPYYEKANIDLNIAGRLELETGWSQWSKPILMPSLVEVYFAGTPRASAERARLFVSRFQKGKISGNSEAFIAGPGDAVGGPAGELDLSTDWSVVALTQTEGDSRVVLVNGQGQTQVHSASEDKDKVQSKLGVSADEPEPPKPKEKDKATDKGAGKTGK
jgi:hypothetical protein